MTAFKLTVPPAAEPVLLADVKAHLRIDTTADDALVASLITAARQWAENFTRRAFITQTWQLWLDLPSSSCEGAWDGVRQVPVTAFTGLGYIALPRAPLQSVNSVQYFDNNDVATVWPAANYFVDTVHEPGRLALRTGSVWPVPMRLTNGIMVEYVAGYGADGTSVPEPIKTALRQLIAHWYEHRGEAATASTARGSVVIPAVNMPLVIEALLNPYRVRQLGA